MSAPGCSGVIAWCPMCWARSRIPARTGLPVQRSMALSFPNDEHAHDWDLQYLLGPALLVAPITEPGKSVRVYLPRATPGGT